MEKGKIVLLFGFLIIIIALVLDKALGIISNNDVLILITYGIGVVTLIVGLVMGKQTRY